MTSPETHISAADSPSARPAHSAPLSLENTQPEATHAPTADGSGAQGGDKLRSRRVWRSATAKAWQAMPSKNQDRMATNIEHFQFVKNPIKHRQRYCSSKYIARFCLCWSDTISLQCNKSSGRHLSSVKDPRVHGALALQSPFNKAYAIILLRGVSRGQRWHRGPNVSRPRSR